MREYAEPVVGLVFILLMSFSVWKGGTNKYDIKAIAQVQQPTPVTEVRKKSTRLEEMAEARELAKQTIQAGFAGSLPTRQK